MAHRLVKCEVLWSRRCPLSCSYCAMPDGRSNTPSLEEWKRGIDNLRTLGCGFAAFYGAEPLADFTKLPQVVGYAESIGIHTTVITSGVVPLFHEKLQQLIDCGARSLTMSYDVLSLDKSSKAKSTAAMSLCGLSWFREHCPSCRDIAVVVTLSRKNYKAVPEAIRHLSAMGIWAFFDIIHPNRGQVGSKCRNTEGTSELMFRVEDWAPLRAVLAEVLSMKTKGFLCHTSCEFVEVMNQHISDMGKLSYGWHCGRDDARVFPSWVTVDCDGKVGMCDDFRPVYAEPVFLWQLAGRWGSFVKQSRGLVQQCPGCLWNTHIDAHAIACGRLAFADYVHGVK